jgi:hypothetical protein
MNLEEFKGVALAALFIMALAGGIWPRRLAYKNANASTFLSLGNCFSG